MKADLVPAKSATPVDPRGSTPVKATRRRRRSRWPTVSRARPSRSARRIGWGAIVARGRAAWWWMFRRWRHPADVARRRRPVPRSCCSASTSSSNASSAGVLMAGASFADVQDGGDAHRAVRAPHAGADEHDARRVDRCDGVPEVRAPATHRRVQVPRRDERRAVARRRRRRAAASPRTRRATMPPRSRCAAATRGIPAYVVMPDTVAR